MSKEKLQKKFELWLALHGLKTLPIGVSCESIGCNYITDCLENGFKKEYSIHQQNGALHICLKWLDDE